MISKYMSLFYDYSETTATDTKLSLEGGEMKGLLNMNYYGLKNVLACVDPADALSRQYLEGDYDVKYKHYDGATHVTLSSTFSPKDSFANGIPLGNLLRTDQNIRVKFNGICVDKDGRPTNEDKKTRLFVHNNSTKISISDSQHSGMTSILYTNNTPMVWTITITKTLVAYVFSVKELSGMTGNEISLSYRIEYK